MAWFSSWGVVSIDTGCRAQSPQPKPGWSPAFKIEAVLSVSSFTTDEEQRTSRLVLHAGFWWGGAFRLGKAWFINKVVNF